MGKSKKRDPRTAVDMEMVMGEKDLKSIKREAEKRNLDTEIIPEGKASGMNVYTVRLYKRGVKISDTKPTVVGGSKSKKKEDNIGSRKTGKTGLTEREIGLGIVQGRKGRHIKLQ